MEKDYKNFQEFLEYKHYKGYTGLDDEMPDDLDNWMCDLDLEDIINYADEYADLYKQK